MFGCCRFLSCVVIRKKEEAVIARVASLDELTNEIISLIKSWETSHEGSRYKYGGRAYLDTVDEQEKEYIKTRDEKRLARKQTNLGLHRVGGSKVHKVFWG